MLNLIATTDKLRITSSVAASLDCVVAHADVSSAVPPVVQDYNRVVLNHAAASTVDLLAAPGGTLRRNVKTIHVRNKHASLTTDVTILFDVSGTSYELYKATLKAGDSLEYVEGVGWFTLAAPTTLNALAGAALAAQGPGFATDTYVLGSGLNVNNRLQAGSFFRWIISMSKTAAGTAAPTFNIRFGTAGAVGDTSRVLFTGPAQTAVADTAWLEIIGTFRVVGATAVLQGELRLHHNLAVTGFATVNPAGVVFLTTTSGTFDSTVANSIIGLSMNGGASAAWTVTSVIAIGNNLIGV